jgi:protein-export membrane protein SecD
MWKKRLLALLILILGMGVAFFVYKSEARFSATNTVAENGEVAAPTGIAAKYPFRLGLDLSGGSHLVYSADVSKIATGEVADSMAALRDVIERRINVLGVSEPVIRIEEGANNEQRLVVDLPGVTDVKKATETIGETPILEFKTENPNPPKETPSIVDANGNVKLDPYAEYYVSTELTGRFLEKSTLEFNQQNRQATVVLQFNAEGAALFEKITTENIGKTIAIYLDGNLISAPSVRQAIAGGRAEITGNFTPQEAKTLVGRLNSGALPVPITLVSTQTIGATLGEKAVTAGAMAALYGILIVGIFLILWYRLPGLIAVISLSLYVVIMLALFKVIPVTLTAAGIAGFIISIGVAVDANVLIFERMKEELKNGRTVSDAIEAGFDRAWTSIRDSNTSSIITALILFWFGSSLIKGFALVFGLGVIISLFSAITVTRVFLRSIPVGNGRAARFLFSSGFFK